MDFINKLKTAFDGPPARDSIGNGRFVTELRAALFVIGAFGQILELPLAPEDGLGPLQSEKRLPYPRERIIWATCFLQMVLDSKVARLEVNRALAPEEAESVLSSRFAESLALVSVMLDWFVPEEALAEQRETAFMVSSAMEIVEGKIKVGGLPSGEENPQSLRIERKDDPFHVTFDDLCRRTGFQRTVMPPLSLRNPKMRYINVSTWEKHLEWLLAPRHPSLPEESVEHRRKNLEFVEAELRKLAAEDDETIYATRWIPIPKTGIK